MKWQVSMERMGSLGNSARIFDYSCDTETKLDSLSHTVQRSFTCVLKTIFMTLGNAFFKQDIS